MSSVNRFYDSYKELQLFDKKTLDWALPFLKEPVLDVGCYDGRKAQYYRYLGINDITECDIVPRQNGVIHNFEKAPFKKQFGSVYAFQVIEHVFDTSNFLKNINYSLQDGGFLVLTFPNLGFWFNRCCILFGKGSRITGGNQFGHIRFFTIETISKALNAAGFEMVSVKGFNLKRFFDFVPMPTSFRNCLFVVAQKKG